jgi:predicted nucleic acid-binding protein
MDAFDADVLIYAASAEHPMGPRIRALFPAREAEPSGRVAGAGSVLLIPELLAKPLRGGETPVVDALVSLLSRLDLLPVDAATAELAAALGAAYGLRAADAVHLATAIAAGADRFITNNPRDFTKSIREVDVVYPTDLPDPRR